MTTPKQPLRKTNLPGIHSPKDLFEKLKIDGTRMEQGWADYDTFNFVITAWHLHNDWIHAAPRGAAGVTQAMKSKTRKVPEEMQLLLGVLRDLCNGQKHFQLDSKSSEKAVIEEVHDGQIGSAYEYFFQERIPGVTAAGDYYFSVRKLRLLILEYFEWVFDEAATADPFPGKLLWKIWWCAPKNHDASAVPPPGAEPGNRGDPGFVA